MKKEDTNKNNKPKKGLSDSELIEKYEAGRIDLQSAINPMINKPKN